MIHEAYAAATQPASQHSSVYVVIMNLVPFILIFAVFYLILILPQRRRAKAQKALLASVKSGDKILLNSGIIGKVVKVKDNDRIIIKTAETTELEVIRSAVVNILSE